jgi:hypothetical protein
MFDVPVFPVIWFGPAAPAGHESNWLQTVPGKGWNTIFRINGALEPWFDKTWKPGENCARRRFASTGSSVPSAARLRKCLGGGSGARATGGCAMWDTNPIGWNWSSNVSVGT